MAAFHVVFLAFALFGLSSGFSADRLTAEDIPIKLPLGFYDICKDDYSNCIGAYSKSEAENHECFTNKDCTTIIGFEVADGQYYFSTMTYNRTYVAVGFADQQGMGNDPVVQCIQDKEDAAPEVYLSLNQGHSNSRQASKEGLELINSQVVEDYLYCKFKLSITTKFDQVTLSLAGDKEYYMIGASGDGEQDKDGNIVNVGHHKGHLFSENKLFKESSGTAVMSSIILVALGLFITHIE